jgi:hypothetical protein
LKESGQRTSLKKDIYFCAVRAPNLAARGKLHSAQAELHLPCKLNFAKQNFTAKTASAVLAYPPT